MRRIWTINGRFLTQRITGVQRYAREIVSALDRQMELRHPLTRDLDVEILCPHGASQDLPLTQIKMRSVGHHGGYIWEQLELPLYARGGILSLCNVGPLLSKKHVVCIHDVNTHLAPTSYSWRFRALYRHLLPALASSASKVVTVSDFSAEQIARIGIAPRDKISVIPNGREHSLCWRPRHSSATRAAARHNPIVVIGSPAPHKNIGMLVGLGPELEAAGLKLAVVGSLDPRIFASVVPVGAASHVHWLGRITDSEIAALLGNCLCLALPSLTEGFGLPALEAMSLGCPVVVSNRASLPEICGDAALYAPPEARHRWLELFIELKRNAELHRELSHRGRVASQRYSWAESGRRYLELLADIDGARTTTDRSYHGGELNVASGSW